MILEVLRFSSGTDSTSGALFEIKDNVRKFLCYTLEDEYRYSKIYGESRIPTGTYEVQFRTVGGFNQKYSSRFYDIHKGMLHIVNVPNFEYVLIHCGNTDEHTAGCLLVGDTQHNNVVEEDGFIGRSTAAYKRIYPPIAEALANGEKVTITYKDYA
tara:strand:+ start:721 stop:1188 length:468 start_codon:yes stop_codon:yes gene_type:complete